jgi:hypothetical protein
LSAASERDCVRELQCLAPDGRPALSLVVSEEYFNSKFNERRRTNESKFMALGENKLETLEVAKDLNT